MKDKFAKKNTFLFTSTENIHSTFDLPIRKFSQDLGSLNFDAMTDLYQQKGYFETQKQFFQKYSLFCSLSLHENIT